MLPEYITGKYPVGTETFTIKDESRRETLGNANGNRKIAVRVYYPAAPESSAMKPAAVFSERKLAAVKKTYRLKTIPAEMLTANYYLNAPYAAGKFPVVLFSHGYNGYVEGNNMLCCMLASEGYFVASVGHAFEACENDYNDGFDEYDRTINKRMYDSVLGALFAQRKLLKFKGASEEAYAKFDMFQKKHFRFVMERVPEWGADMLCALGTVKSRYAEHADTARVAAAGHSLGGAAAYWLCRNCGEIACGVNIDGGVFGDYDGHDMDKPFLQIGCEENRNVETLPLLNTKAPVESVFFAGMKHIGFTDAKFFGMPAAIVGKADGAEVFGKVSADILRFLGKYMESQH